jgi:hypothetical protein
MLFRAVIYSIDHSINILWLTDAGNWFNFRHRSYRKDREAIRQVLEKGQQIKSKVESIYIEGNPIPLFSKLDVKVASLEHWKEMVNKAGNKPVEPNFLAKLFGAT